MAFVDAIPVDRKLGVTLFDLNGGVKIPPDAKSVWVRLLLDNNILKNPDFDVTVWISLSDDGVEFSRLCGIGCEGPKYSEVPTQPPSMRFTGESLNQLLGKVVRVEFDSKTEKTIGVEVEVL